MPGGLTVPSPFYRVTSKAIIFDDAGRLVVVKNHHGDWELPGGGWEHDEDFSSGLAREIREELGVEVRTIGDICIMYRGCNERRGFMTLRLVSPVILMSYDFRQGDDMQEIRHVLRREFLSMDFTASEGEIAAQVDKIWEYAPAIDKIAPNL